MGQAGRYTYEMSSEEYLFWVGFGVYWVSYFVIRLRLKKRSKGWDVAWLANMALALWLIWKYGETTILLILMTIGLVGHHGDILLEFSRLSKWYSPRIHGIITHVLFFVPFGVEGVVRGGNTLVVGTCAVIALLGILVGIGKIKLRYR